MQNIYANNEEMEKNMTIIKSEDMTNEEYHAHHAFGSTAVKTAANKSIAHLFGAERKESPAFALGSAVHAMLLEPEKDLIVRGPETRRGKAWSDLKDECDASGKILLTEADYTLANNMADACLQNRMANHLLTNPDMLAEASFFATDPDIDIDLKTRPDGLLRQAGIVLDIKTTQDASPRGFDRSVRQFGYDLQAAFYMHVLKLNGIRVENFIFICIEKDAPHVTACHELSEMYLRHAHNRMIAALHDIKHAIETEEYGTNWPDLNTIHLPAWLDSEEAF
jgi:hypothetical protein